MSKTVTFTSKVSLRPYMKPILVLSALLRWDWLTNKCFKIEAVTSDTVQL
ncbi:hypothetical protein [Enterobacter hormaechei]|nr:MULTISPECIES: hypothetical protein [Enterobacter]MBU5620781.1 hypothetical protein [Enterobacteriaceae bacterium S5_ASV_15]HBK4747232.1 hypothetical protein [Enterobacter hormaechei subsp. steigerwaltii]MCW3890393.1 hypothetical protein [Enterobacter hormaechei subsp. hoffmannii]MDU6466794.1 hypothetical protein [Enterobacter sp.]CZY50649.1 Uncharacterised protein [Enterobacter hormaechei]